MPLDSAEFRHVVMDGNQHIVAVGVEVLVTLCADLGKPFIPLRLEARQGDIIGVGQDRSEEHTSELQSLMRISYAVFCLNKTTNTNAHIIYHLMVQNKQ